MLEKFKTVSSTRDLFFVNRFAFVLGLLESLNSVPQSLEVFHKLLGGHPLQVRLFPLFHGGCGLDCLGECRLGFIFEVAHSIVSGGVTGAFVLCSSGSGGG